MSTGLLVFLGLSRCQLGVTALGLGPIWFCVCGMFQHKTQKNPVERSAFDMRRTAAHYVKNRMINGERPKCKLRMESSIRLILSTLIRTSVPNRTLWCHPSASSGILGSTAGHQRSASHGVLHYVSRQRQEMVSCLHDWTASEGGEALIVEVHCLAGPYGVSLPTKHTLCVRPWRWRHLQIYRHHTSVCIS